MSRIGKWQADLEPLARFLKPVLVQRCDVGPDVPCGHAFSSKIRGFLEADKG